MRARARIAFVALGLGVAQLIAWGALYYAIAVLAEPMRGELGASRSEVFGAFSAALIISGLLAPWAGRMIDARGGRVVLASSAGIGALAFGVLSQASSVAGLVAGWSIAGIAMALGLYDPCFAAIGQAQPARYRALVTSVTLVAGFASTVFWPLTHALTTTLSWRAICGAYAVALLMCAPIYLGVLPPAARDAQDAAPLRLARRPKLRLARKSAPPRAALPRGVLWLSWAFAGAAVISSALSAHLVGVLGALVAEQDVVWIASSIGALQVLGRVADLLFGARRSPAALGALTFALLALSMLCLVGTASVPWLVFGFALLYGIANGLTTIVRATLPVSLLGFENVGATLGVFSAPSLVVRALAPLGFALLVDSTSLMTALWSLTLLAASALGAYAAARSGGRPRGVGDGISIFTFCRCGKK